MSISIEEAWRYADRPELLKLVSEGLQKFLTATAAAGFQLPMRVELRDSDGDLLREFTVARGGKIVPGRTDDAEKLYVFPLVATATDATGRVAVLTLDAEAVKAVEFVN